MYEQIEDNLARGRHALASITTIEGAGHYASDSILLRCHALLTKTLPVPQVPTQMPEELAKEIAHILQVHADESHVAKL